MLIFLSVCHLLDAKQMKQVTLFPKDQMVFISIKKNHPIYSHVHDVWIGWFTLHSIID